MSFSNERLKKFKNYGELREEIFSKEEQKELDSEIKLEISAMNDLQESISKAIVSYMAKEQIGFNEFTRRLGSSSRQTSRVIKGEANLTLATLAEISSVIGKKPRLIFE